MAASEFIIFNCLNAGCGKQIKIKRPQKSGVYNVTCPHCGCRKQFSLTGHDGQAAQPETPPPPPAPDNSGKEPIELKEDFRTGAKYTVKCPHCGKMEFGFSTEKPGHRTVPCPRCKGPIGIDVRKPTQVFQVTEQVSLFKGKLILLRKGWINKTFRLDEGVTVIGRHDETEMSDISIKGDSTMSRRSIEIKTERGEKGYTFKLTVRKAKNPVLHNSCPLMAGESVSLNFGDTITLGKTKLRFEKDS